VRFHLATGERRTILLLSMNIRCWDELVRYGAQDVINREYGAYVRAEVEPEYHVSLEFDTEQLPSGGMRCGIAWFDDCSQLFCQRLSMRSLNRSPCSSETLLLRPSSLRSAPSRRWTAPQGLRSLWRSTIATKRRFTSRRALIASRCSSRLSSERRRIGSSPRSSCRFVPGSAAGPVEGL
jgi:hypothetical protein